LQSDLDLDLDHGVIQAISHHELPPGELLARRGQRLCILHVGVRVVVVPKQHRRQQPRVEGCRLQRSRGHSFPLVKPFVNAARLSPPPSISPSLSGRRADAEYVFCKTSACSETCSSLGGVEAPSSTNKPLPWHARYFVSVHLEQLRRIRGGVDGHSHGKPLLVLEPRGQAAHCQALTDDVDVGAALLLWMSASLRIGGLDWLQRQQRLESVACIASQRSRASNGLSKCRCKASTG